MIHKFANNHIFSPQILFVIFVFNLDFDFYRIELIIMSEERLYKHPSNEAQSSIKLRFSIDAKDKNKDKKDNSGFGSGLGFGKETKEFDTSTPNTSKKFTILLNKKLKKCGRNSK